VPSPLHYLDDPETRARERAAFLEAAMELIGQTGSMDLQVAAVVRQAGRHNAAFYRIFGAKEGLVLAIVEEAARRTAAALTRRMADASTPADAVRAWAGVLLGLAAADPTTGVPAIALDRYRVLKRFPDADATIADPLRRPLAELLQTAGVADAEELTEAAFELVLSRQASWIALGRMPTAKQIRTYADFTVRLVGLEGRST
jgi:AcrR family transcriptional regulator